MTQIERNAQTASAGSPHQANAGGSRKAWPWVSSAVAGRVTPGFARYALLILLVLLVLGFSFGLPGTFATSSNFNAIVSSEEVLLILAIAVVIPLRGGDFDLSISSIMVLSGVVAALLTTREHIPVAAACVIALIISTAVGTLNGIIVVYGQLNAFIVTLGSMTVIMGATEALTGSVAISGLPNGLLNFTNATWFGLPRGAYYAWALALVLLYIFEMTPIGRHSLVIGKSRRSAELVGLRVSTVRVANFTLAGVIAGFAGIVWAGSLGSVDPTVGTQYLLPPYVAAFLGTAAFKLGEFNILGTVVGLYLVVVVITGLELMGVSSWVSDVFEGAVLVGALLFARLMGSRYTVSGVHI